MTAEPAAPGPPDEWRAELGLRLRAEELIEGSAPRGVEEAVGALADVESVATALSATGLVAPPVSVSIVASTVDALVVRGASWVEAKAVDLDVRRLYDLAAGTPRPLLRGVVPVARGSVTSVDLWDDRAEARVVDARGEVAPSLHLGAVPVDDDRLVLRDGGGGTLDVDLARGRGATEGGSTRRIDPVEYLSRLVAHAASAVRRDPSVEVLNAQRRRVAAVGEALGDPSAVVRFDDAVAKVDGATGPSVSSLVEVVPVAVRTPFGWLLSLERWTDHWRVVARSDGRGLWAAVDDAGAGFGGDVLDGEVLRFDPALSPTWSWLTISRIGDDGTVVDVDVVRP